MQKFNIIEIATIVSKQSYLSIVIKYIDMVYNPLINEYGIALHLNIKNLTSLQASDSFIYEIVKHFVLKLTVNLFNDYKASTIAQNDTNDIILIY